MFQSLNDDAVSVHLTTICSCSHAHAHCVTEQWKINKFTVYYVALASHIRLLNRFFLSSSSGGEIFAPSESNRQFFSLSRWLTPSKAYLDALISHTRDINNFFMRHIVLLELTHRYTRSLNYKIVANWLLPTIATWYRCIRCVYGKRWCTFHFSHSDLR